MKRTIRLVVTLGLIAALFMTAHAEPTVADDASPDGTARVRPPHPCSVSGNLRRQWESEKEIVDRLEAIKNRKWEEYLEARDRPDDLKHEIIRHISWESFSDCANWDNPYAEISVECVIEVCEARIQSLRDNNYCTNPPNLYDDWADELQELLDELLAAFAEVDSAHDAYREADDKWWQAFSDLEALEATLDHWQRECDRTRVTTSISDSPWRNEEPESMRVVDSTLVRDQMEDPMGSDANQASNETQSVIPFGVLEYAQPPQAATGQVAMPETDTPAVTPSRARLFNNLPERSTPGAVQSTPEVTAETMQVQQPGSANTGTSSLGYTHMPLPQNAGQSGTAVAPPPKSLRILTPVRRMLINPGRSIKR